MHAGLDLAGSLTVFNGTGEENKIKKPMGSKKHRAITYQFLPQAKNPLDLGKKPLSYC